MRRQKATRRLVLIPTLLVLVASGCGGADKPIEVKLLSPRACKSWGGGANGVYPLQATKAAEGPSGERAVMIASGLPNETTSIIAEIDHPGANTHEYALRGRAKYVAGQGSCLQLLNTSEEAPTLLSRSLSDGDMRSLSGSSDWRDFELPFPVHPGMRPDRLSLGVILQGPGWITVAEPLVVAPLAGTNGWWNQRQSPPAASILSIGLASVATLTGLVAARGHARWARRLCLMGIAGSIVTLAVGFVALAGGQPWYVFFPLIVTGGVGAGGLGINLAAHQRRLRTAELRRMTAADVI